MHVTQELADILSQVDRSGDYVVAGRAEFLAPRIEVEGVGLIALPLLPAQAKQLIKAATRAPFGRGAETVVDTNVRRTGPAVEAHQQFILWLVPTVEKFPRSQKFLLGDRIQTTALDVLEALIEATYTRDRRSHPAYIMV